MSSHLIDRVKFDIQADNTSEAKEIQDKIFSICRYQLDTALDASMAEDADQLTLVSDQLVLDLGHIPKDYLESQLIPRLLEAFSGAIADLKPEFQSDDKLKNDLDALRLFLEKGARHWSKGDDFEPMNDLIAMLNNYWPSFLKFLKRTQMPMQVSTRIVSISSDNTYRQLITKLRSSDSDFIMGFIKSSVTVMENTKSVTQPKSRWESSLKALVLHDLIRNHNSLFNRKMFIHRQLMGLAARHRVDYLELLQLFDELLADQEIAYKFHSSLPALIKELTDDVQQTPKRAPIKKDQPGWLILFDKDNWQPQHKDKVKANWKSWTSQYPGEMKLSFDSEIRTVDQVDFIVDKLSDQQVDDLIGVLIPHLSKYVISYKRSVIKGNKDSNTLTTAEENLKRTLNFLIISYLTLDMGTSFNKREFFTQQIVRISRHYNLAYQGVVTFLVRTLESAGEPILFGMLELIRQIGENLIPDPVSDSGPAFEAQDELELLFYYLENGRLHPEMIDARPRHPFEFLSRILTNDKYASEILEFIHGLRSVLVERVRVYDTSIYLQLIQLALSRKLALSGREVKSISGQIKKHLRQSVDQGLFRAYIFKYITGLGKKIKASEVKKYDLDSMQDPYSLLCRFLIIKLSLNEFYSDKLGAASGNPRVMTKALSYEQAHVQLFASLDHLMIPDKTNLFHQTQLQSSLSKILESKQESQSLLHALNLSQLLYLLRLSNKVARFKVLQVLSAKFKIIGLLIEKLDIRVIDEEQLKGWEVIVQLDYTQSAEHLQGPLEEAFDQLNLGVHDKQEIFEQFDQIKKYHDKGKKAEIEILVKFFESAKTPKGWSLSAIETLFLKHYNRNYRLLTKSLVAVIYSKQVVEKLYQLLGENILIRWTKMILGNEFDLFQNESSYLKQIITGLGKGEGEHWIDQAAFDKLKILMVYEFQFREINFASLLRSFLRYYAAQETLDFKSFVPALHASLKKSVFQIQHDMLKRRASEMQEILAASLPVEDEVGAIGQEEHELGDSYKIENAGLVLVWPFLKNLFGQLDYLSEAGEFKSSYEQSIAVRLLQYAATGETDQPEYNMTLNKLLCGYPLVEPLETTAEISESDMKMTDSMLEGLIANWSKLGNTTVEGLRNTFMSRKGSLSREESNWTLRVEKKGMDVLLDFLPWTLTNVKTPWLEGMLFVEWR